jgi:hypothetical protein
MAQTTVNFNLKTAGFANFANQTLSFRLLTAGADKTDDTVVLPGVVTATSAADGTGSVALFRNGDSDIDSVFEVIFPNREKSKFVIPVSTSSIHLSDLLVDHVPSGSDTQQSSVYAAAIQRANHTGTQPLSTISDSSTVQLKPSEGAFANGDKTKLDGIEASATADQTNAEIRAAVEAATDSNVFTDADHTKLNGIEASATTDQTASEIRALVESATDSNVFTDADHTKLNAIEASADVTDTTNVYNAGALMDSEVDADIKTLSLPASTTISSYGKTLTDDASADEARATLGSVPVNFVPRSISFTNTSAYLSLADNANLDVGTGHFSLVFYAKLDSSGTEPVFTKLSGTGYRLRFVSGSLILTLQDSGGSADFTLATGLNDFKWHTYVISITRNGNAITYVDNVVKSTVDVSGTAGNLDNAGEFRIGSDGGSNAADEVALGNYVILIKQPLDAGEAAQVYFDPDGIFLTDDPSVMVDLRRADRTFTDVSTNALAVTTNGTIIYNQERITSLSGVGDINCSSISADVAATGLNVIFDGTDTGDNKITLTDNLASALDITESSNSYLKFTTTNSGEKVVVGKDLEISGTTTAAAVTGTNVLATTTLGYTTGSGGTVTQGTSKSTTVALNKATGQITLHGAALTANTNVAFALTNSTIAANDILVFNHVSGGTIGAYNFNAIAGSGTATVTVRNITGSDLTEAPVVSFAVIKAVTS